MNKEVYNAKVDVPSNTSMNDLNYLTDIEGTVKGMVNNYSYALNEASNIQFYQVIKGIFEDITSMQRTLYDLMFQQGWYIIEEADKNKVTQKYNQYNNQTNEMV